jgi:hypothetical protein
MTSEELLQAAATLPPEEWMKIQSGLADMICAQFSTAETSEIRAALAEAEAEFDRGEGLDLEAVKRWLGLA